MARQIRLNLNLQTAGRHDAAWKRLGDTRELVTDVDYYVSIAKLAERGKFDAIFLADSHGSLRGESTRRPWRGLEPTVLLAAIARDTELQRRGRFRTEYEYETFRENLGVA